MNVVLLDVQLNDLASQLTSCPWALRYASNRVGQGASEASSLTIPLSEVTRHLSGNACGAT
jgi:hypothetical protein